MIILWTEDDKMTVWGSVAGIHDKVELAKQLIIANRYMGLDPPHWVRATNDLGDEVFYDKLMELLKKHDDK